MKPTSRYIKTIKAVAVISMLIVLIAAVTSCQDLGFPSTEPTPEETPEPEPAEKTPTIIRSKDAAIMAVYQHLLAQAESSEAKLYLSDFYASCDNWTAESEYFKDGSGTWHIAVDMTQDTDWELRPYWQQASWFVFKDGRVIPSNLFEANALRIEADLQELSPQPEPEAD
jgi:hypothetical protein